MMWGIVARLETPVLWSSLLLPVCAAAVLIWSGQLSTGSAVADSIILSAWCAHDVLHMAFFFVQRVIQVQPSMLHALWTNSKWKIISLVGSR